MPGKHRDVPLEVRISECKRRLAKGTLPADVRRTQERILQSLTHEQQQLDKEKRAKKLASKYKAVRFFEKRKVTRKLKSAIKRDLSASGGGSSEELRTEVTDLKKRLNYIVHFPLDQKYLSLFASSETADEKGVTKRDDMIENIWRQVMSGELTDASSSTEFEASHHTKTSSLRCGSKTAGGDGDIRGGGRKRQTVTASGGSHTTEEKQSNFFL